MSKKGSSRSVNEHIRDSIRRNKDQTEKAAIDQLKADLTNAFAAPETSYKPLTASEVIARNRT